MLSQKLKSALGGILGFSLIIILSCLISQYGIQYSITKGVFNQDLLYKLLGESRRIFSRVCMMRADEYFHGGVTLAAMKCRSGANVEHGEHDGHAHEEEEHVHSLDGHEEKPVNAYKQVEAIKGVSKWNVLFYMGQLISIDKHVHLRKEEQKEMVPWYIFATELDPNNIHAYVIGGYWIGQVLDSPEEGIAFLSSGLRKNPDAWQLYSSMAEIYLSEIKDYPKALSFFQKAASLFTRENVTRHESWEILMYIAGCYQFLGNKKEALVRYQWISKYFPEDKVSAMKVRELSAQVTP